MSDQLDIFDRKPLDMGGIKLHQSTTTFAKRVSLPQWTAALQFAFATHHASPIWIGMLWNYGEAREDWQGRLPQAMADAGLDLEVETCRNYGSVVRQVTPEALAVAPSLSHATAVMALPAPEQVDFMRQAREEDLTTRDVRLRVRHAKRRKVLEGQAILKGQYRVIYADPPWRYRDRPASGVGQAEHYEGMAVEDLMALPVEDHAMSDSVLHMWVTAPMLYESPGPRDVIAAWGFEPKTQRIWDKATHNWGHYYSVQHEILVVATRGSCTPDRQPTPQLSTVVREKPNPQHSKKPEIFRQDIERQWDGPYLELFATGRVDGWDCYGNDAALWGAEAEAG